MVKCKNGCLNWIYLYYPSLIHTCYKKKYIYILVNTLVFVKIFVTLSPLFFLLIFYSRNQSTQRQLVLISDRANDVAVAGWRALNKEIGNSPEGIRNTSYCYLLLKFFFIFFFFLLPFFLLYFSQVFLFLTDGSNTVYVPCTRCETWTK